MILSTSKIVLLCHGTSGPLEQQVSHAVRMNRTGTPAHAVTELRPLDGLRLKKVTDAPFSQRLELGGQQQRAYERSLKADSSR